MGFVIASRGIGSLLRSSLPNARVDRVDCPLRPYRQTVRWQRRVNVSSKAEGGLPTREAPVAAGLRGLVLDMDGTCVRPNIDFKDMRVRVGIPQGDLFTVLQQWDNEEQVHRAMSIIEEIEQEASATLELMRGMEDLLDFCAGHRIKVALVTRNTKRAVAAFFRLLGESRASIFSIVLTREFRHVKPDKRILEYIAKEWDTVPRSILMVGDSVEDIEVGNAAGSPTCRILGGGNETRSVSPMKQGQATIETTDLLELTQLLQSGSASEACIAQHPTMEPLEMSFIDFLFARGFMRAAFCTYPRLTAAFGCEESFTFNGDQVVHYQCGDGLLTKLFGSLGVHVIATDHSLEMRSLVQNRGLPVVAPDAVAKGFFDGVIAYAESWIIPPDWLVNDPSSHLVEMKTFLRYGGIIGLEFPCIGNAESVCDTLAEEGYTVPSIDPSSIERAARNAGLRVESILTFERELTFPDNEALVNDLVAQTRLAGPDLERFLMASGTRRRLLESAMNSVVLRRSRVVLRYGF